jgi:hypothetical protein
LCENRSAKVPVRASESKAWTPIFFFPIFFFGKTVQKSWKTVGMKIEQRSKYENFVSSKGYSLESSLGVSEYALTLTDAVSAVHLAIACCIPILGGDVYYRLSGQIKPAYANWHVERREGETAEEYINRSGKETELYIASLPKLADQEYLIVIVT